MNNDVNDTFESVSPEERAQATFLDRNRGWCEKYAVLLTKLGAIEVRFQGVELNYDPENQGERSQFILMG